MRSRDGVSVSRIAGFTAGVNRGVRQSVDIGVGGRAVVKDGINTGVTEGVIVGVTTYVFT